MNFSNSQCEVVMVGLRCMGCIISVVYRPPNCSYNKFKETIDKIDQAIEQTMATVSKYQDNIIMGDFNFPSNDWSNNEYPTSESQESQQVRILMDLIEKRFMTNIVDKPTRHENILDLIFTSNDKIVNNYDIIKTDLTDHDMVFADLNTTKSTNENYKRVNHCMTNLVTIIRAVWELIKW